MIIVSDTSVLSGLLSISRLGLLGEIYGKVIVPKAVFNELLVLEDFGFDLTSLQNAAWLEIAEPNNLVLVAELKLVLDQGESAAIVLAQELQPDYLAIDEKKGREVAEAMGIPIIGLVGILIIARQKSIIEKVKPVLDELIEKAGFRISRKFYGYILDKIGEQE